MYDELYALLFKEKEEIVDCLNNYLLWFYCPRKYNAVIITKNITAFSYNEVIDHG